MHALEQEQREPPARGQSGSLLCPCGPLLAVLASLAAAWIAAGSTGLLAHPLRRVLTLLMLAIALLAPGIGTRRSWRRLMLTPAIASLAAYLIMLPAVPANVLAVALVLAFLAFVSREDHKDVFFAASTAVTVLGLYVFARTSIPWIWLASDGLGRCMGALGGLLAARPLHVGATFAGLDLLVLMGVFWPLCLRCTRPPRTGRAIYGFLAILGGHVVYLVVLAHIPNLLESFPEPTGSTGFSPA